MFQPASPGPEHILQSSGQVLPWRTLTWRKGGNMKVNKTSMRRLAWALLAGASALLLATGLSLLLSHFQALAQPAVEVAADGLAVDKEVNTALAAPGDTLTYTITVRNTGDTTTDAWLTDTLPVELTCITDSLGATFGSFGVEDNVITWTAEMYGYNYTAVISFSAQISSEITYANVVNTAQVTGTGELVEDSATTTVVVEVGNLDNTGTYKSVSSGEADPGDVLTYTIRVTNDDTDSVPDARFIDTLPTELIYVSGSLNALTGSAGFENGVITWSHTLGGLTYDEVSFRAQISPDLPYDGWITNTVEIVAPLQSFTRSVGTYVQRPYGHLEASKSVYPSWARPGEHLTYTVHIVNTGDATVETAWMTDALPSEVSYVAGSLDATTGGFGAAGDVITWTGSLDPSGAATVTLAAQIESTLSENTRFTNTAEITGTGTLVLASAPATAKTHFDFYFPIIFRNYPPRPVLNDIPEPDANNAYTVSWSAVSIPIDRYVLQEATDANFNNVTQVFTTTATSQFIQKGSMHGTFYYRVRADDDDHWGQGPWSDVKSVTLNIDYHDSFGDPSSGWTTHTAKCCLSDCDDARQHLDYKYSLYYEGGRYHVNIPLDCRASGGEHGDTRHIYPISFAPGIERPTSETCIQLKGRFEEWDPYWSFWGLVFAASDDMSTVYSLEVNDLGDWAIIKRTGYQYPGPNHPWKNETRTAIVAYTGGHRHPANSGFTPNTLRVRVTNQKVKLFINGQEVYTFSDAEIPSLRRVGIIGGDWEITPTQIGYDYFFVDEGCDTY